MPRKKSEGSEAKKSRKASKDRINSSPAGEILPPPMPTEAHLVASNPFDDIASSSPMHPGHSPRFQGMHPGGMVSPSYAPQMGPGPGPAGWNHPRGMRPHFASPYGPHMGNDMGGPYVGMPPQQLSPNSFNMNRPMMGGHPVPGMPPHPGYRGPIRMPRDGMGSPLQPAGKFQVNRLPGMPMGPMGNQGHMPPGQMKMQSSRKSSISSEGGSKPRKEPKSRKKSKSSEKKAALLEAEKQKNNENSLKNELPKLNTSAPHAAPPNGVQTCIKCKIEINFPSEDCVRCIASCNNWYHRKCSGLTKPALRHLQSEEYALWACDTCISTKEINSIRDTMNFTMDTKPNLLVASS